MAIIEREKNLTHLTQLVEKLAGPLHEFLDDSMIYEADGLPQRFTELAPIVMVWCMIWQSLNNDQTCRAVLAWLQANRAELGSELLSGDTGAYCKARKRLSPDLLPILSTQVAEQSLNLDYTEHLWQGQRILAVDGSSFSMPDTVENQERYPQPSGTKSWLRFS